MDKEIKESRRWRDGWTGGWGASFDCMGRGGGGSVSALRFTRAVTLCGIHDLPLFSDEEYEPVDGPLRLSLMMSREE